MNILFVLVPLALLLGLGGLAAFFWALRSGQYDDMEGDALRILGEDEGPADADAGPGLRPKSGTAPRNQ